MNTEIYLIRHAQCEANKLGIISGALDDELTEDGVFQAERLKEMLIKKNIGFDQFYTSTAKRAVDTAKIIAPHFVPSRHSELLEIDTGSFEFQHTSKKGVSFHVQDYINEPFPNGESYLDLYTRATNWFDNLTFEAGNKIGIVAHGGSLGVIIHHIIQDKKLLNFPLFKLSNASLTHITMNIEKKKYFFHTINFTL